MKLEKTVKSGNNLKNNEELAKLEYEALQAEKRDKMTARLQVWSLLIGLVSVFGLASIQAGAVSYIVILYPLLAVCIARYAGHSESILDQIKAYLLEVEKQNGYQGYEHFNRTHKRQTSGGHKKALRDALFLTDLLAITIVMTRLFLDHFPLWVLLVVAILEGAAIIATCRCLREEGKREATR